MDTHNTLCEWSDGDDDGVFEGQSRTRAILVSSGSSDSEVQRSRTRAISVSSGSSDSEVQRSRTRAISVSSGSSDSEVERPQRSRTISEASSSSDSEVERSQRSRTISEASCSSDSEVEWSKRGRTRAISETSEEEVSSSSSDSEVEGPLRSRTRAISADSSSSDSEVERSQRSRTISEASCSSDSEVERSETSEEEESVTETQAGQGEKRKSDSDDEREHSYYEITGTKERTSKKFKTTIKDTEIRFNNAVENMDLIDERNRTYTIIQHLVDDVTGGVKDRDQIHFVLRSDQLDRPIALPFMPRAQFTPERVFAAVERVAQSNREFRLNDTVHVNVWHVEMPEGSGKSRQKRTEPNLKKYLLKKTHSVVVIENHDDLCLARALVVAIAKAENDPYYHYLRACDRGQQRRAVELHANANVPLGPCGLEEVRLFQRHLTRYEINIVSLLQDNAIIYPPQDQAAPDKIPIYLALHDNHYDVITKMPGFLNRAYFCHKCKKAYSNKYDHLCPEMCKSCRAYECAWDGVGGMLCDQCKRRFRSRACYDRHKVRVNGTKSICDTIYKCVKCKKSVDKRKSKSHGCGKKCPTCNVLLKDIEAKHKCYMQKPKQSDESAYDQMYFFDFECKQETGEHVPNFCVVQDEKGNEEIFKGDNTVKDFCEWVLRKDHEKCIFVAHNFKGYDSYFIQDYLNKQCIQFELICTGAKIMSLTVPMYDIKFIDSYNFIPMALARFPETFDRNELRKGYFPHMFNKDDKQDYVGPIPEAHYYLPNTMKPEARQEFLQWHAEQVENNYVFDFQKEMESYCRSDVDILRKCCLDFRDILEETTGVDPFEKCLTIASVCHMVYSTNYLVENTIAVFSDEQRLKTKTSNKAVKWLSWLAETEEIDIEHARNGGEKRIGGYSVDGFCEERNTVYEFHGCFWHGKYYGASLRGFFLSNFYFSLVIFIFPPGCTTCYPNGETVNPKNDRTMQDLRDNTMEKALYLTNEGHRVVELWECELDKKLEEDAEMRRYFDEYEIVDPLNPRDAFYGGRTNAAKLFHTCEGDEEIRYYSE